jgi:hypothetical protein
MGPTASLPTVCPLSIGSGNPAVEIREFDVVDQGVETLRQ